MLRIVQMSTEDTSKMKFKIKVKAVEDPDVVQKVSLFLFHHENQPFRKMVFLQRSRFLNFWVSEEVHDKF